MNTTHTTPAHLQSRRPEAGLRDASFHDLFIDCCRFGPAPTRSREAFVIVVTVILLSGVFAIVAPAPAVVLGVTVAVAAYLAVRWVVGTRTRWAAQ